MTAHTAALALFLAAAPPALHQWVTDDAQALTPATRQRLEARLAEYEQQSGHQVVVYIARTTGGEPIEDFAVRSFKQWKIGRPEVDDGVALFVFTQDRTARIEVGYGLENVLTDTVSSRILRTRLIPQMQAGNIDGAVSTTVDAMLHKLGPGEPPPSQVHKVHVAAAVIGVLLFIVLAIWQPRLAWLLLMVLMGRRRGGGGFGGGGRGFGGGGGRSGGAGASGRW
jgi:uncharacterized protein